VRESKSYKKLIVAISIIIPVAVAVLFGVKIEGYNFSFLPRVYASINGFTAVLLVIALVAIKNGKRIIHEQIMKTSMGLSALFLVLYIAYHMTSESTEFRGDGGIKYIYYFILISHILLSIAVVPLVLFTFERAISGDFARHKRVAKFAFPIWLDVAVTGVIVSWMISPYYT
jgi:putative membrane protein